MAVFISQLDCLAGFRGNLDCFDNSQGAQAFAPGNLWRAFTTNYAGEMVDLIDKWVRSVTINNVC